MPESIRVMNGEGKTDLAAQRHSGVVELVDACRVGEGDDAVTVKFKYGGEVAGAGIDVFEVEPAKESPLFTLENGQLHFKSY